MQNDISATYGLVRIVVIEHGLYAVILPPDLDAGGVGDIIASPQHEFVGVSVWVEPVIDQAAALELGSGSHHMGMIPRKAAKADLFLFQQIVPCQIIGHRHAEGLPAGFFPEFFILRAGCGVCHR